MTDDKYIDVYGNDIPAFSFRPRTGLFLDNKMTHKAAMFTSLKQDWQTPLWLYEQIKRMHNITDNYDTDPATSEDNPLGCKLFYTEKTDGLANRWMGKVFINPPFGYGYDRDGKWTYFTGVWIEEAWRRVFELGTGEVELVTMLLPARTSPKVFHKYIWDFEKWQAKDNVKVTFLPKRIKFGKSTHSAPFDSMLVDFYSPKFLQKGFIQQGSESVIDN